MHRTHSRSLELETLVPLTPELTAKSRAEGDQLGAPRAEPTIAPHPAKPRRGEPVSTRFKLGFQAVLT
jgi:hypothetical protein